MATEAVGYNNSQQQMEKDNVSSATMYLSTIPNQHKSKTYIRSNLDISDISGAKSRYLQHSLYQRTTNINSNDIEKSHPKQLIPSQVNKPSFTLEVDDIQGTRTKVNKFTTTRHTNPLCPEYQSPHVVYVPVQEPKFIRDNMAIDDIEGVRRKETFANRIQRSGKTINTKEAISVDIKPTPKGFIRSRTSNDFWNVRDINTGQNFYQSQAKRLTNPLEPRYNVAGQKAYGQIEGSRYIPRNGGLPLRQNNSLLTADIQGAKPKYNNFVVGKKEDVPGSKPESLKRGISSNRKTNPLQPNYNYPGCSQTSSNGYRPKTAAQRLDAFLK